MSSLSDSTLEAIRRAAQVSILRKVSWEQRAELSDVVMGHVEGEDSAEQMLAGLAERLCLTVSQLLGEEPIPELGES